MTYLFSATGRFVFIQPIYLEKWINKCTSSSSICVWLRTTETDFLWLNIITKGAEIHLLAHMSTRYKFFYVSNRQIYCEWLSSWHYRYIDKYQKFGEQLFESHLAWLDSVLMINYYALSHFYCKNNNNKILFKPALVSLNFFQIKSRNFVIK